MILSPKPGQMECEFCEMIIYVKEDHSMKKPMFTAEQIAFALRQAYSGSTMP